MRCDKVLLSGNFSDLTALYLQKMFDIVLLCRFFRDLTARYHDSLNKSSIVTSDWMLFQ